MNSFDYAKLTENPRPQQQEVNMAEIVVHPPQHQYNAQRQFPGPRWSWGTLILSMCSMCCCQLFGFIATVISILSYVDHKSKDFVRSQNKRNHARNLAIAGIVIGVLLVIVWFAIVYALVMNAKNAGEDIQSAFNQIGSEVQSEIDTPPPYDSLGEGWGN